ncbi:P-loop NTPase fold protein [Burkholderia gladioli]|uniref:P-loop NTPase fold protein n=1 Tax=Burkholderia gladioli TaxID=28095 RepID=UPI00163E25E0|nr:P-loop NTPase fold protein [Burkholderia gladioli]
MSLEKTKKQLIELLGNADNKVIALSGRWGTGKTYLWNEVKAESKDVRVRRALYVSLFGLSSIDQVKRKLMEGALPDAAVGGGKLDIVKNLFKSGVQAAATHYKALAAINDLNLLLVAPLALRERVIVIDDIERKHAKLGIDEILGFIDEYSKEFEARFVLVLNDDQLATEGEQRTLWTTFREKVIDQEIKLSTTPDEAFSIAIKLVASPKYEVTLKLAIIACGLTNIRIIGKVIRVANQILADRDLSDPIQARVVPSIVLFGAIYYRGLEDGPNFQFALNVGNPEWSKRFRGKKGELTEEEKREDRWRMLMSELGINSCDDFEKVLVEFLESGLFDSDKVQAIIERYIGEAQTIEARQNVRAFIKKAIWDHRAADADLIAEATGFPAVAGQLDPYVATELHGVLSELDGGQRLAEQVIQAWIAAFQARGGHAPGDDNPFGTPLHPDIQATFDIVDSQQQAQATVVDACNYIIEHNGWGTLQEVAMKRATADDFESAIREMGIQDLQKFMRQMIQMRLQRGVYDPHFGHATTRFMEACRAIANDQSPESARLAKLMKKLFARTALAIELESAQPRQPPDDAEQL